MERNESSNSTVSNQMNLNSKSEKIKEESFSHKVFKCPDESCGKIFQGKGSLKVHLRSHTNERPYKCEFAFCEKSFSTKGNWKAHLFIHKNIKPFSCPHPNCEKKYINECRLKVHQRTHIGQKPFPCKVCEKSFNEKGNLKTHMRIHTGERPFKCNSEGCPSAFKTSGHLKDHMKIHFDIKPYKCNICSKKYSRSCTLKIHLRTHSGEKPFLCPYEGCGKIFSEKGNMKNHAKNHLKNQEKKTNLQQNLSDRNSQLPYEDETLLNTPLKPIPERFSTISTPPKRLFSTDILTDNRSCRSVIENEMFVDSDVSNNGDYFCNNYSQNNILSLNFFSNFNDNYYNSGREFNNESGTCTGFVRNYEYEFINENNLLNNSKSKNLSWILN